MVWLIVVLLITMPVLYWAGRLVLLYVQIDSNRHYWTTSNALPATDDQLIYVALGDSTAQGIGAGDPKKSYPYLVKDWLEKETGRSVKLINLSVSGAKVADVQKYQLAELYHLPKSHVVTVSVGANDIATFRADDFEKQMDEVVRALPRESYVATLPAFTGRAKKQDWKCVQANKFLVPMLATTNHHLVNLYKATSANKGPWYFAADWFHPNARAYRVWAKAFEIVMAERIPELLVEKH